MGYKFIPLSATPYGAVGTPFENFLALLANTSEELGGQNYEQALTLLQNNLTITIQKANVEILLQAQANSSSLHQSNQARVDQEPAHYTPTVTHDKPTQPQQHPFSSQNLASNYHTHTISKIRTSKFPTVLYCLQETSISIAPFSSCKQRHTLKSSENFPYQTCHMIRSTTKH
jgi:hypothetical protein